MKKRLMSVAVAAALAGAGSANAVFVNQEGSGEALIYPYFTVEGGNDTYINLVNTTNEYKAVKVRFLEAMNSKEVLDFNLYMSPRDHWSAVIYDDGEGASIRTADTTCTVPNSLGEGAEIEFRATEYADDSVNGRIRTREGYVEIIEMGVLTDSDDQAAIKHAAGVPDDCSVMSANWNTGGKWDAAEGADVDAPGGGLYGYGVLINVNEGTNATYDAVALDDFADPIAGDLHFAPGSVLPSLGNAGASADVLDSGSVTVVSDNFATGFDAVSAVLMHSSIQNDYVLEPSIQAGTDWVITFPTKFPYVNNGTDTATPPFTEVWDPETSLACESITIEYWDREEAENAPDPLDFSPAPDQDPFSLCHEANVLTINGSDVLSGSERVASNLELADGFDNGWMEIDFTGTDREVTSDGGIVFEGLPSVGFAVQKYVNGTLAGGTVLSNYAGVVQHKNLRSITP